MIARQANIVGFASASLALTLPFAAAAQTVEAPSGNRQESAPHDAAATPQQGDIVVTATCHGAALLDVPVSVTAYTQQTLDTKGVKSIADIGRITPGLTVSPGFAGTTSINIRGVASAIGAGTTGVYINGTPIQVRFVGASATSTSAYPAIFDLSRVEVLRGPQGTLFGAGSTGGTVRFITPDPPLSGALDGYARTELAFTAIGAPSFEVGAAFGGAVIEDSLERAR